MKISFKHKYERGGEEIEYIQVWDRKVLVARRSLGRVEDMYNLVLDTAVWLITHTREVEEQEVVAMETGEPEHEKLI